MTTPLKIKIKKEVALTYLLFIIYPLASIPLIIRGMVNRERYAFMLWGIFMGIIGLLMPPTGDLFRYTQDSYIVRDLTFNEFVLYASLKFDFTLIYLSYFLSLINVNFDISRFIFNSISYTLWGYLYLDIINMNTSISKRQNVLFLIIFIPFSLSGFLYRYSFSTILFLYGSYKLLYFKKKNGWIYIVIAVLSHISFLIFLFGILLCKINLFRLNKKAVLILCLVSLVMDSSIAIYMLNLLPINIIDRFMIYLDGYWSGEFLNDHTLKFKIQLFISKVISIAIIVIYYLSYNSYSRDKITLSNYILFLVALTTPFTVINGRFLSVFMCNFKIVFLRFYKNTLTFKRYAYILVALTILSTLTGIWSKRREWTIGDGNMIFYSSLPSLLTHTYSENWINANIFENGDFKH